MNDDDARALQRAADHSYEVLARSELPFDTVELARYLIGKVVVRAAPEGVLSGRIVETEAYPVGDAAGHAYRGETARNRALFLSRGHAYVYLAYGVSYMLNVSSEAAGIGAGVLIRALAPIEGIATMQRHRRVQNMRDLARGPGRLASAFSIDRALDGVDLCREGPLWIARDLGAALDIGTSTRIGLSREADRLLRFYVRGDRFVSGPKALNRRVGARVELQRDISSRASWLVRGPNNRMVAATITMAPPISRKTPVTPNELRKKAMKKPVKIVLKRLQE
jgi:DNA-3-methyladenine glycosylase